MPDVQRVERLLDVREVRLLTVRLEEGKLCIALRITELSDHRLCDVNDLGTPIAIFIELDRVAKLLEITCAHRLRQFAHLVAGVVEVVFADNIVACPLEQVGYCSAESYLPSVTCMQQAGWVSGYPLDVDGLALMLSCAAERFTSLKRLPQLAV